MPELLFSLPAEALDAERGRIAMGAQAGAPYAARDPAALSGIWEDDRGEALAPAIEIGRIESIPIEYPTGTGGFGWSEIDVPPAFTADPPDGSAALAVYADDLLVAHVQRERLTERAASLPRPREELVGPADARFVFPVISERFETWEPFIARVQELRAWIAQRAPFDDPRIGGRLALRALFWPSDPRRGLFDTHDGRSQGGRLFHGERALAKTLLDRWIDGARPNLILINSGARGGAGGVPGYSAWTSTSAAPGEPWQAVGLHEIGHALGLGDEYLDPQRAHDFPAEFEPNISARAQAGSAPWRDLITVAAHLAPSHATHQQAGDLAGVIGTFQGARYRDDLYRPAQTCLMRDTRAGFCPVCQRAIAAAL